MKFTVNAKSYIEKQEVFTGEMVARISEHLEDEGIAGKRLKDLTGKIAFEIACMIDDSSGLEFDGVKSNPYLTFISDENPNEAIHLGGNSYCHEIVFGILNAILPDKEV